MLNFLIFKKQEVSEELQYVDYLIHENLNFGNELINGKNEFFIGENNYIPMLIPKDKPFFIKNKHLFYFNKLKPIFNCETSDNHLYWVDILKSNSHIIAYFFRQILSNFIPKILKNYIIVEKTIKDLKCNTIGRYLSIINNKYLTIIDLFDHDCQSILQLIFYRFREFKAN